MFCTICGSEVGDRDTICLSCGSRTTHISSSYVTTGSVGGLHPLGIGERLDAAFKMYFANFASSAKAIALLAVPFAVLEAIITASTKLHPNTIEQNQFGGPPHINYGQLWTFFAGLLVVTVISSLLTMLASAAVLQIVGGAIVGAPVPWKTAIQRATRRLPSLLWIGVIIFAAMILPLLVVVGLGVAFLALHVKVAAIVIFVVGGFAYMAYMIWLYPSQALAVPTLMLEDIRGVRALRRSITLVRGTWGSVWVTLFLAGVLTLILGGIVTAILALLSAAASHNATWSFVVVVIRELVTLIIFTPFSAALLAILSIDMRVRKEGLDIELLANKLESPGPLGPPDVAVTGTGFPSLSSPMASPGWRLGDPPPSGPSPE